MIVGSISEDRSFENRVAITPEVLKKYKALGIEVQLCKDYATHLGINDEEYKIEGANIIDQNDDIFSSSNAILQMNIPGDDNLNKLKKDQILIGVLDPYSNEKKLKEYHQKM